MLDLVGNPEERLSRDAGKRKPVFRADDQTQYSCTNRLAMHETGQRLLLRSYIHVYMLRIAYYAGSVNRYIDQPAHFSLRFYNDEVTSIIFLLGVEEDCKCHCATLILALGQKMEKKT